VSAGASPPEAVPQNRPQHPDPAMLVQVVATAGCRVPAGRGVDWVASVRPGDVIGHRFGVGAVAAVTTLTTPFFVRMTSAPILRLTDIRAEGSHGSPAVTNARVAPLCGWPPA